MQAIELNAPRVVPIEDRGRTFTFTVARIGEREWLKYFGGIVSMSETQGAGRVDTFDSSAARLELVTAALVKAEGYGGLPDCNWRELIPARQRLAVGNTLISVRREDPPEGDALALGRENVYLSAVWGAPEVGKKLAKLSGLRHTFETPTADHQRRYSRAISQSRILGTGRNGKTAWLGAQPVLAEIYGELILEVEGYTLDGQPLAGRDAIAANMDTYHKVAAAEGLFEVPEVSIDGEGK